ncbi:MAG: hypothetical protein HS116_17595 [Planctomycetes bacterium]|nr:hypothetical protein [Planctomycetota bacterium]
MEIQFCDQCGKRLTPAELQAAAAEKKTCTACAPKAAPVAAHTPTGPAVPIRPPSGIGEAPTQRRAPVRGTSQLSPIARGTPGRGAVASPEASKMPFVILGVGAAVALVGLMVFMSGGKQPPAQTAKAKGSEAGQSMNLAHPPAPQAPAPAPRMDSAKTVALPVAAPKRVEADAKPAERLEAPAAMDDIREGLARRKFDAIKTAFAEKKEHPYHLRKQLEEFVNSYRSTAAGRDAAALLERTPAVEPPPPPEQVAAAQLKQSGGSGENNIQVAVLQDGAADERFYREGSRDTAELYNGKAFSWRGKEFNNGYFSSKLGVSFHEKAPTITDDMWMQFAVKLEGASHLCIHSGFDDNVFETWVRGQPKGKWIWVTVKAVDYKRAIRGTGTHPTAGMKYSGTTIYTGQDGKPSKIWLGPVLVGSGTPPSTPE